MPYLGLIVLLIWIAALVDVIVADEYRVQHLPKVAWVIIVILIPLAGSLVWFLVGRPAGPVGIEPRRRAPAARPTSPDDDEEFLRSLRRRAEEQRRKGREIRDAEDEA